MLDEREVEKRILAELEEAGEEDVPTMLNTIFPPTGNASELNAFVAALEYLVGVDMVRMSTSYDDTEQLADLTKAESLEELTALPSNLLFGADRHWSDIRHATGESYVPPFPYIVVTEAGLSQAREILRERGYQWWRRSE